MVDDNEHLIFLKRVTKFNRDEITQLSLERRGEMSNLIKGISNQCFGINLKSLDSIDFEYFNYERELNGFSLKLKYKEKYFYTLLYDYVFYLSKKFDTLDAVALYNTFVRLYRTVLEENSITTITNFDAKRGKRENSLIVIGGEYEVVHYIDEVELYRDILQFKKDDSFKKGNQVYLMYSESRREFKIGRSKNPAKRKLQGKTFDQTIVLLKTWEGTSELEARLKNKFINKNLGGEWFKLNLQDLSKFNDIIDEYRT